VSLPAAAARDITRLTSLFRSWQALVRGHHGPPGD